MLTSIEWLQGGISGQRQLPSEAGIRRIPIPVVKLRSDGAQLGGFGSARTRQIRGLAYATRDEAIERAQGEIDGYRRRFVEDLCRPTRAGYARTLRSTARPGGAAAAVRQGMRCAGSAVWFWPCGPEVVGRRDAGACWWARSGAIRCLRA